MKMEEVPEKGYLFAHTYGLEEKEIFDLINNEILKLDLENKNYNLKINVVKNKNNFKLGYSYLWIDNEKIFNALIGLNYDGSKRIKKEVKITEEKNIDLKSYQGNWGNLVEEEEIIIQELEPLINFPDIKLSIEDKKNYRIETDETEFSLQPAKIFVNYNNKNSIFSRRIPRWLNENKIKKYFEVFEKDKRLHSRKGEKFTYPIVKIKNSMVNVIFSNLYPNTASFVYNMARKVNFKDNNNECLLIFYQNTKKD